MVSHLRRDGALARKRHVPTKAALERQVPVERRIGEHRLRFDLFTSRRMRVVRQEGTGAEVVVRALVSRMGLRFSVRNRDLPGSPDLANRTRKWAIFVQGCFWHAHLGCRKATLPKRNRSYWVAKFAANRARDARAVRELRRLGYDAVTVWECRLAPRWVGALVRRLERRLLRISRAGSARCGS